MRQPYYQVQGVRMFSSEKPDGEEGSGRKLPSGFEKLLKRAKRGGSEKKETEKEKKEEKAQESEDEEPKEKESKG